MNVGKLKLVTLDWYQGGVVFWDENGEDVGGIGQQEKIKVLVAGKGTIVRAYKELQAIDKLQRDHAQLLQLASHVGEARRKVHSVRDSTDPRFKREAADALNSAASNLAVFVLQLEEDVDDTK